MAGFGTLTAVAAPVGIDNLDAERIFPARFSSKDRRDGAFAAYFLHDMRFGRDGRPFPGFILNDERLRGARILVAGANYAYGSGRPGAVFSQVDFGIRAIIAESFGAVLASVAYKAGLLAIQLPPVQVALLREQLQARLEAAVTIELGTQLVLAPDGTRMPFSIDPLVKRLIAEGRSEVELTLAMDDAITAIEARRWAAAPWVFARPGNAATEPRA